MSKLRSVALAPEFVPVPFEPAWDRLEIVEHTEETIERVLRRELAHLFTHRTQPRRPSRREVASRGRRPRLR